MPRPKNRPRLSTDPADRVGVYKRLEDVPDRYRLQNHQTAYESRDVWEDFFEEKTEAFDTKSTRNRYEKAGRYLKNFLSDTGCHHALLTPDYVEDFLIALRDGNVGRHSHTRNIQTVYFEYFQPVEAFYTWLEWHTEYPHVYHPVRMAAIEGGYTREVWNRKLKQNDKR